MGAVGLSFGSPTSGAGFNVTTTVASLVSNMQAAETPYNIQLTSLHAQDTVISNLGTLMSTLSTDIENLSGSDRCAFSTYRIKLQYQCFAAHRCLDRVQLPARTVLWSANWPRLRLPMAVLCLRAIP